MKRLILATLFVPVAVLAAAPPAEKAIDVRGMRPSTPSSFEGLWSTIRKASASSERDGGSAAMAEIERLRVERNIRSLDSFARALVARAMERVAQGDNAGAEADARQAIILDPSMPDAHFGLARVQEHGGPLGYLGAFKTRLDGLLSFFATTRGARHLSLLAWPTLFLTLSIVTLMWAAALVARHGSLLRHDIAERLGPGRSVWALGLFMALMAVPVLLLQGFGWLPLWWLALLYTYMNSIERWLTAALVAATVAIGPVAHLLEWQANISRAPLFQAMETALDAGPDERALADLQAAAAQSPDDRDLTYLSAILLRKAGRYEDAAEVYRGILAQHADDVYAANDLANLDFAAHEFGAAVARYKQVVARDVPPQVEATVRYNLSLAYLQRFERQQAEEARSQAERAAGDLVRRYDALWQYRNGEYAVVDLSMSHEQLWAKFAEQPGRITRKNLAGQDVAPALWGPLLSGLLNRFTLAGLLFGALVVAIEMLRGRRMFTLRCLKCGTPFCRRCHLGTVVGGLCTQCHHLFVVRDGVSGPARNQKLLEVQSEDERRDRVFRALSLFSPGAGQIYGERPLTGIALGFVWYGVLLLVVLSGRLFPVTEVPSTLGGRGGLLLAGLLLVAAYALANWLRPAPEVSAAFSRQRRTRG